VIRDPRCAKLLHDVKGHAHPIAAELNALVVGVLERGIQSGAFRPDLDPRVAAAAILGSIGGVIEMLATERSLSELVSVLADLHSHMVASPALLVQAVESGCNPAVGVEVVARP